MAYFQGHDGVSALYRDYAKSLTNPKSKLSAYGSKRVHEHYVIGLLVTRLKAVKKDSAKIASILHRVFENKQIISMGNKSQGEVRKIRRSLGRLPTVAVVVLPDDGQSGMIASFTVFGSTSELRAKQRVGGKGGKGPIADES